MCTGEPLNTHSLFVVDSNGKLMHAAQITSMDTLNARHWHEPTNERDYQRSPQRDLWRTAKELKCAVVCEILDSRTQETISVNEQVSLSSDFVQSNKMISQKYQNITF
jgi:hypothetical protein